MCESFQVATLYESDLISVLVCLPLVHMLVQAPINRQQQLELSLVKIIAQKRHVSWEKLRHRTADNRDPSCSVDTMPKSALSQSISVGRVLVLGILMFHRTCILRTRPSVIGVRSADVDTVSASCMLGSSCPAHVYSVRNPHWSE